MLSPVHFQGPEPQRVSCYAFFKWWLLLSLHPRCLWFKTPFVTLSIYFGTLTPVSVVLVSRQYLTHWRPLPSFTVNRFRVGISSVTFRLCELNPYFTPFTSMMRLYWGIFQQEPAIAGLDRLFTPNRSSSKSLYTSLVQTSILLSENFVLATTRSTGFGSYSCDYRHFWLAFAAACFLNLAT